MSKYSDPTTSEPTPESLQKTVSEFGTGTKEKILTQVKQDPAKTISIIVAGAIVTGFLLGYCLSRMEEGNKRHRLIEDGVQEIANWIRQRGRNIAAPIKEGFDATRSAVEEASQSGVRAGRKFQPFFEKQKRSFLNLF
jgi:hypothetical protein